jgi:iron(III) transport system substrate-binding protein
MLSSFGCQQGDQDRLVLYSAQSEAIADSLIEMYREVSDSIARRPARFVPNHHRWVPTTALFRVVAYNSTAIDSTDLPDSVLDLPGRNELKGRIGWTPAYSSF